MPRATQLTQEDTHISTTITPHHAGQPRRRRLPGQHPYLRRRDLRGLCHILQHGGKNVPPASLSSPARNTPHVRAHQGFMFFMKAAGSRDACGIDCIAVWMAWQGIAQGVHSYEVELEGPLANARGGLIMALCPHSAWQARRPKRIVSK